MLVNPEDNNMEESKPKQKPAAKMPDNKMEDGESVKKNQENSEVLDSGIEEFVLSKNIEENPILKMKKKQLEELKEDIKKIPEEIIECKLRKIEVKLLECEISMAESNKISENFQKMFEDARD